VGRILAVDLGTRRVGLALSDPMRMIASPLRTVPFLGEARLLEEILSLVAEKSVDLVLVGLPVMEDGREGEGCLRSRRFLARLSGAGVAAEPWDESWTSRDAEDALRSVGKKRKQAVESVDRVAASILLRDYLDSR
jgi:putative holliday junction resolvase